MRAYGLGETSQHRRGFDAAHDVQRIAAGIANVYLVGTPGRWVLVDTGLPGLARRIRRAAARRFGPHSKPAAIILTHGHFDHSGNVDALARHWNVPVYAHPLELSYLAGRSQYPPQDPTVGGAIGLLSRTFPRGGQKRVATTILPLGDEVPGMAEWRCIHMPGHTAGHVCLYRASDGVLLAGDALTTINLDSWVKQVRRYPELCGPPAPLTFDWEGAISSVRALAALSPRVIAAGHGLPVAGDGVAESLQRFAARLAPPSRGRYVAEPAAMGPAGLEWVPPPVPDPLARAARATLLFVGGLGVAAAGRRLRRA